MATYKCKKPYMYGTGRRKSSVARVHLIPNGTGAITINGRDIDDYFGLEKVGGQAVLGSHQWAPTP